MTNTPIQRLNWPALVSAAISALGVVIMINMVNAMLPTLVQQLGVDLLAVQWIVLAYSAANAASLVAFGHLGDMIGRKRVFISGFAVFGMGSLLCSFATSFPMLLAFRALQALGASMLASGNLAIAASSVPARQRAQGVAVIYLTSALARVIGPSVAGYLVQTVGWRAVFATEVPICLIGAVAAWRYVPDLPGDDQQSLDPISVAALAAMVITVTAALNQGPRIGWSSPWLLGLTALGLGCGMLLVVRSQHRRDPLLDLSLFRNRLFVLSNVAVFVSNGDWAVLGFVLPFFLQGVLGYSPAQMGLLLVSLPLVQMAVNPLSAWLADRYDARVPTTAGLALQSIGLLAMSTITTQTSMIGLVVRLGMGGLCLGMNAAPNTAAVLGSVSPEHAGTASGFTVTMRHLGMVTAVAILGSFFASRSLYHAQLLGSGSVEVGYGGGFRDTVRLLAAVDAVAAVLSWLRGPRSATPAA